VLARAATAGVPARYIAVAGRTKDVYDDDVTAAFTDAGVSLVLLVGYMRILSSQVYARSCTVASYNFTMYYYNVLYKVT
jgi:folate-dependent phosphoribosylglycinamide formyltransferase PurN